MNIIIKTMLLATALMLWGTSDASTAQDRNAASQEAAFNHALELLRTGRHAAAYGRLMKLADAGHVRSAQLTTVMLAHGKTLYGSEWSASPDQQLRWNGLIVNQMRHHSVVLGATSGE